MAAFNIFMKYLIVKESKKQHNCTKHIRNFCIQNSCKLQELGYKVLIILLTPYRLHTLRNIFLRKNYKILSIAATHKIDILDNDSLKTDFFEIF